jgi:creatinine amidohydrolase
MPGAMSAGHKDFVAMGMNQAYCGSPAWATAEEGEQTYNTLVELVLELIGPQVIREA